MEFCKNSNNEEYIENKHSEGNNVEKDKEADEMLERALQGEGDGRKNTNLSLLHVQSIRDFQVSLQYSGGEEHLFLWKGKYANFKSGPAMYQYQMVEEHCPVHSIKISKGSSRIAPLSLSFGIKRRRVLNFTPYQFTPR